jgi:hypothetical protein
MRSRRGSDCIVVEFTTTYKCMQLVPITTDVVSSNLDQGEVYLRQISGFLRVLRFPPPIKLTTTI